MKTILTLLACLTLAGCYDISISLTKADESVQAIRRSSDCAPIIFGIGGGTATLEAALQQPARNLQDATAPRLPIQRIRSVQLNRVYMLVGGGDCVEVIGE